MLFYVLWFNYFKVIKVINKTLPVSQRSPIQPDLQPFKQFPFCILHVRCPGEKLSLQFALQRSHPFPKNPFLQPTNVRENYFIEAENIFLNVIKLVFESSLHL
jgi:hypothetical protein